VKFPRLIVFGGLGLLSAAIQPALSEEATGQDTPDAFASIPNLSFKYYDVNGTDWGSIKASLDAAGPRHGEGGIAHGRTDYRIAPTWTEMRRGASCQVTNVQVQFSAVVLLPRLADEASAPERLRDEWRRFVTLLQRHESGHARIAFENLGEVKTAVAGSLCGQEPTNATAALERIEALQLDYDRRTQNGRAQGDVLR
jgi:predicted secreted Zn-dependent protease